MKRGRREIKRLKVYLHLGRVVRDLKRNLNEHTVRMPSIDMC